MNQEKAYCKHGVHMSIRCLPCELKRRSEEENRKSIKRISDSIRKFDK